MYNIGGEMPYVSFFKSCLTHLIPRVVAVYPDPNAIEILMEYKCKFDNALSEIQQSKIMDEAMSRFKVCMWMKDIDSNFIYHNQSCREIILSTVMPNSVLFLRDNDFVDNALASLCLYSDGVVIKEGKMARFIEKAIYYNGESRWLDICKAPTKTPSGRINGTMGTGILINRIVSKELMTNHKGGISIRIPMNTVLTTEEVSSIVKLPEEEKASE